MNAWSTMLNTLYLHYKVRRLHRLINFFHVLLGIVLVNGWTIDSSEMRITMDIFVILGVLMYGSLHALNNIADRQEDKKNKRKAHRIIASGQLSLKELYIDVVACIIISLILLWNYYPKFLGFALLFIALNISYSYIVKRFHHVIGTLMMAWSIPLRLMVGVTVAGGNIGEYWMWYVLVWAGVVMEVSRKIQHEHRRYSGIMLKTLRVFLLMLFSILAATLLLVGYRVSLLAIYCIYYVGYQVLYFYSPRVRQLAYFVWTT